MDWLLQKATELGVASITPLYSEYTDVSLSKERLQKKMQHWQKIIVSACEQSGRVRVPVVAEPRDILEWISEVKADIKTLLHPYHSQPISTLSQYQNKVKSLALLVGPEGGLKDSEVDHGMHHQFISLGLGPRILRAETAPLAAIAIMQSVLGDG